MAGTIRDDLKQLRASGVVPTPSPTGATPSQPQPGQPEQTQAAWIKQVLDDLGTGVAKGGGETAVNLGKVVHATPGLGSLTDALAKLVGPEGTDPNAAFAQSTDQMGLGADNATQGVGKFAEQIMELMATAPVAGGAASSAAHVPYSVQPLLKNLVTPSRIVKTLSQALGEGAIGGADAMLHNDESPGHSAGMMAAAPIAGESIAAAAPLLKNPNIQKVLAYLAAIAGMKVGGGISEGGIAGGMGAFGLSKMFANQMMRSPTAVDTVQKVARRGLPAAARVLSAADTQSRNK